MSELDDFAALAASDLFDRPWYLSQNGDVSGSGLDPLLHYFKFGAAEGRRPNAHFDPVWYRERAGVPDDQETLLHYIREGIGREIPPNPYFDPDWYRRAYALSPGTPVLADYLAHRRAPGRVPSAILYAVSRLPAYVDGQTADPVGHYIDMLSRTGAEPDVDVPAVLASGLFDANYYLINGSDVMEAALEPIAHFCGFGWQEGRNPNIYFNTRWYLKTNPDAARLGVNPLLHFIVQGERADRRPVVYFEPGWYREHYQVPANMSALSHFMQHRRGQRVSPNSLFDLPYYMAQNGAAIGGNRDPFAHFLQTGTYKDIDPSATFNSAAYRRAKLGRTSRHFQHKLHPDTDNPLVHFMHATYR